MQCQLDQVRGILDMAAAAGDSVMKNCPDGPGVFHFGRMTGPVIYGLLLLNNYDVFMQKGLIELGGKKRDHFWVEVYFEGEAFVLDVAAARFGEEGGEGRDILFMPKDEACELYCYEQGRYLDWNPVDCDREVWRSALSILGIDKEVDDLLEEITELSVL